MTVEWVGVITDHSHPRAGDFPDTGSLLWLLPSMSQQSHFLFRRTSECAKLWERGGAEGSSEIGFSSVADGIVSPKIDVYLEL